MNIKILCYGQIIMALLCILLGGLYLSEAKEFSDNTKEMEPKYRQFSQMIKEGKITTTNREKAADLFERQYESIKDYSDIYYDIFQNSIIFGSLIILLPIAVLMKLSRNKTESNNQLHEERAKDTRPVS